MPCDENNQRFRSPKDKASINELQTDQFADPSIFDDP